MPGSATSSTLQVLQKNANLSVTSPEEVSETCKIALYHLNWKEDHKESSDVGCACMLSPYSSVDPAPVNPKHINISSEELGGMLINNCLPLFERYRVMFSLRNRGGIDAVQQLNRALLEDSSSALFRHEVAYVLGQMQQPESISALSDCLGN